VESTSIFVEKCKW